MVNNVCVIVRRPLAEERFTLGLRNALATQMGGFETSLVVIGRALLSMTGSMPEYLSNTLAAYLENEGRLFLLEPDLKDLGIKPEDITVAQAKVVDSDDLAEILEDSDAINTF